MQRWLWRLVPWTVSLVAFLWPLYYLFRTPGGDWDYFDSLAMVVRSSVHTYGRFPMHDPWQMGGYDLLINPQTRIFSPIGLLDLVLWPHIANVFSLVILGGFGAWGMLAVLERLGNDRRTSALGSLVFIGGSWFMLHFCEGHIPYGSMQLLPWVVLFLMDLDKPYAQLKLTALLAFFILDGGVYAFIYSLYGALGLMAVGMVPLRGFFASVRARPLFLPGLAAAFVGVTAPKTLPIMDAIGFRGMQIEAATMPFKLLLAAFFDPDQWFQRSAYPLLWRFHEIGCYLGYAATLLIIVAAVHPQFVKTYWRWFAFALIFFWIGTNYLYPFNPWVITSHTPLLRNAHVQSRAFIWMYFAWVILMCAAARSLRWKPLVGQVALCVAVLEIVAVSQRHWYRAMHNDGAHARYLATARNITAREWKHTVLWGIKPDHYFPGGVGSVDSYEPAKIDRMTRYVGGKGYYGEIRAMGDVGTAKLIEVSPTYIGFTYDGATPAMVRINQNVLAGWRVDVGNAELDIGDMSIGVKVFTPGEIVLRYQPWYWPDIIWAFALGLLVFVAVGIRLREQQDA